MPPGCCTNVDQRVRHRRRWRPRRIIHASDLGGEARRREDAWSACCHCSAPRRRSFVPPAAATVDHLDAHGMRAQRPQSASGDLALNSFNVMPDGCQRSDTDIARRRCVGVDHLAIEFANAPWCPASKRFPAVVLRSADRNAEALDREAALIVVDANAHVMYAGLRSGGRPRDQSTARVDGHPRRRAGQRVAQRIAVGIAGLGVVLIDSGDGGGE